MSYDYSAQPRHIKVAEAATASKLLTDAVRPGVLDVTWDAKGVRVSTCRVDVHLVVLPEHGKVLPVSPEPTTATAVCVHCHTGTPGPLAPL